MILSETAMIDAPIDAVFHVLTDFAGYSRWNPWIIAVDGECQPGRVVTVRVDMGGKQRTVRHRLERVDAPVFLQWCDLGWFTIFAFGRRSRYLASLPSGLVEYRAMLSISGPLAWLVKRLYGRSLAEGLLRETQALKTFIEQCHER